MGLKHRHRVYQIPPGLVTSDERLLLVVLAEETIDAKDEWGHDRDVLVAMCGLDPADDNDHRWLRDRLRDLEDAGFITRRDQRKLSDGRWGKGPSIRLNFAEEVPWSTFSATKRAEEHVKARLNRSIGVQRWRDGRGVVDPDDRAVPAAVDGVSTGSLDEYKRTLVEICGEPTIGSQWALLNRVAAMARDRGDPPERLRYVASRLAEEWDSKAVTVASIEKYYNRYDAEVGQITDADVQLANRDRSQAERAQAILEAAASPPRPSQRRRRD